MSQRMADLNNFQKRYPSSAYMAFENMATLMFMQRLNLSDPPVRRKNQTGIEADPVDVPNDIDPYCKAGRYAYQAKYLEPKTDISQKKRELIKSIDTARQENVTDLFFYFNKDLHEYSKNGSKPTFEEQIIKVANNAKIRLHWYTKKMIETELGIPSYGYIREMFLCDENAPDISYFYEYICRKMNCGNSEAAYGSMSLIESYIEPLICRRGVAWETSYENNKSAYPENAYNEYTQNVRDYLETIVDGDQFISIICGEPGHGKTSLCRKAAYDFYKNNWLQNKVLNVFIFSVNPAGTDVQNNKRLDNVTSLFSWGDTYARAKSGHKLDIEDCGNALIFLDGFDELLEWIPDYSIEKFLDKICLFLNSFEAYNGCKKPHIVITTRKMALDPKKESYIVGSTRGETRVPVYELQLIPKEQQYLWIQKHWKAVPSRIEMQNDVGRRLLNSHENSALMHHENTEFTDSEYYLQKYVNMYENLAPQDELKQILGIPIIFRMIVMQNYIPKGEHHLASIYEELFEITYYRNSNRANVTHDMAYMKKKLMLHALRVFLDNNDSAEVTERIGEKEASWIYAFYTRYEKPTNKYERGKFTSRVGFLHKTIYEHFLACEILSWFRCAEDTETYRIYERVLDREHGNRKDPPLFQDIISLLGKRKLSVEILSSIQELYERDQQNAEDEHIDDSAFDKAYRILKKTDGILYSPYRFESAENNVANTPLIHGENVFCNIISICSVCGHPVNSDIINVRAMQYYDLKGIFLNGANLRQVNLDKARFANASLINTDFTGANLNQACLSEATLSGYFDKAIFNKANLNGATLSGSFDNADFKRASLSDANLSKGSFLGADMEGSLLSCAIFVQNNEQAKISEINIEGARLSQARLNGKQLKALNLKKIIGRPQNISKGYKNPLVPSIKELWNHNSSFIIEKAHLSETLEYDRIPAFGHYCQGSAGEIEPLSWRILKKENKKVLAITEKLIDCVCYNDTLSPEVTWESCTLREWLNEDFLYGSFNKKERASIIRSRNENADKTSYTDSSKPTWDKIFALSIDEAEHYFRTDADRRAAITAFANRQGSFSDDHFKTKNGEVSGWWWLRSLGHDSGEAAHIYHNGAVNGVGDNLNTKGICVRPALWINLDAIDY